MEVTSKNNQYVNDLLFIRTKPPIKCEEHVRFMNFVLIFSDFHNKRCVGD